jgi:hypothetical protein
MFAKNRYGKLSAKKLEIKFSASKRSGMLETSKSYAQT